MWKSLHRAFPTMDELFKRCSAPNSTCPICHNQDESIEHLLLLCQRVEPVWFGGILNLKIDRDTVSSWVEWVLSFSMEHGSPNYDKMALLSYVAFSCWHIWEARCNFLYNNCQINPTQVLCAISNSARAFFEVVRRNPNPSDQGTVAIREPMWFTPPTMFTKINIDASWSAPACSGFVGVVLQDADGFFVAATRHAIRAPSVGAAEMMAILKGCEFGLALGLQKVLVESDSFDSVCSLSESLEMGGWEAFPSLAKAKRLGESFQDCRWSWIPSSANMTTDSLASQQYTEM
ncbi:uncharacterized protein LOC125468393 [Pyrus x bretschneideri]|uniref:uncharacterized protein LOC125468393 n=1 Tax=Pyrus x bretschneideri TaxID=225117 RepID=UPI00202DD087|nr:uncharacterized protein LOC125468393 [Pyrus x bretschneideri]